MTQQEHLDRREKRFELDDCDLTIKVIRLNEPAGEKREFNAMPMDVSFNGIKLKADCPLLFEEPLGLQFVSAKSEIDFKAAAEVRWIRGSDDGEWIIGCLIVTELPEDCLDRLSSSGGVDRRRGRRIETKLEAEIQLQGENDRHPVTLLDYSAHGVRFSCEPDVQIGQPIKFYLTNEVGNELAILATSKWKREYESGYLIGCEITNGCQIKFRRWVEWLSEKACVTPDNSPLVKAAWAAALVASVLIWLF